MSITSAASLKVNFVMLLQQYNIKCAIENAHGLLAGIMPRHKKKTSPEYQPD